MDRDFSNVRNCTECANYHTCRDAMYGSTKCNPKPKEEPETGA